MAILVFLLLLSMPFIVVKLLHAQQSTALGVALPQKRRAYSDAMQIDTGKDDGLAWSALDDRQLNRLLSDSAPRAATD